VRRVEEARELEAWHTEPRVLPVATKVAVIPTPGCCSAAGYLPPSDKEDVLYTVLVRESAPVFMPPFQLTRFKSVFWKKGWGMH